MIDRVLRPLGMASFAVLLLSLLTLAACGGTSRPPDVVEFVGASVTAGWYSSGTLHAYPQVAIDVLNHKGDNVTSRVRAIPGATVNNALNWDIHQPANVVVVQMGSNNFAYNTALSDFAPLYRQLVTTLRSASPRADLVCLGQWHRSGIHDANGNTPEDFDKVMAAACQASHGTFEPLEAVYDVPTNHGPLGSRSPYGLRDLLHPNDVGDKAIANVVVQGLAKQPPLGKTGQPAQ